MYFQSHSTLVKKFSEENSFQTFTEALILVRATLSAFNLIQVDNYLHRGSGWRAPLPAGVREAMMDRVLKDRHWKHDLLQANVPLWVRIVRNYSYRDGSRNRSTRGTFTQATPRALHAFQFPQNVLISFSTSPIATVEMINFYEEIAAGCGVGIGWGGAKDGPCWGHVCLQELSDDEQSWFWLYIICKIPD